MNPAALKHEENKKEFEYLQQENERLRNKISQLQNNLDLSTTFDGIVLFFEGPLTKLNDLFDLAAAEGNGKGKTNYIPILERTENKDFGGDDDKKSNITNNIRYRLRSDVTLHFYASSAPCK